MKRSMTRVLSFLVVMGLVLCTIPMLSVFAAQVGGLTTSASGEYVSISSEQAYTGVNSMKIKASASGTAVGNSTDVGIATGETYAIEFYVYPIANGNAWVSLSGNTRAYVRYDGNNCWDSRAMFSSAKVGETGWYKFSGTLAVAPASWEPSIFVVENGFEFYLDDFSITNVNNGKTKKLDFEPAYDKAKNLMAEQVGDSRVSVSWMNPSQPVASKIELFDITDGEEVLLDDSFPVDGGAINEYIQEDVSGVTGKLYRLVFNYDDGAVRSQVIGCNFGKMVAEYTTVGNWVLKNAFTPKSPARLNLDDVEYRSAAPSVHIISNDTTYNTNSSYLQLLVPGTIPAGKYRLEYYTKMNNSKYFWSYAFDKNEGDFRTYPVPTWGEDKINNAAGWELKTRDYTLAEAVTDAHAFTFEIQGYTEDFWIDDVSLIALDDAGFPVTGENLLGADGDLSIAAPAPEAPIGVSADIAGMLNETTVHFTAPADAKYVAIYQADKEEPPVAYVPAGIGQVNLKHLPGKKNYDFVLKSINSEGRESAVGTPISVIPNPTPWILGDFKASKTGDQVTVSVYIENNADDTKTTAQLALAVYDGKTLTAFDATDVTDVTVAAANSGVTLTKTITVPEGSAMRMYLWDSLDGMTVLKKSEMYQ